MPRPRREAGLTLVEIMISVLLVGIAAAFVFSIQVRTSQALRDQSSVAEVQMTLRSATDVILHDVRQAGYLAKLVSLNQAGSTVTLSPIMIGNSSTQPDTLQLQYADASTSVHICPKGPSKTDTCPGNSSKNSAETDVDSLSDIKEGDVLMAVYIGPKTATVDYGTGCMLEVTGTQVAGKFLKIQHHPTADWNSGGNQQCDALKDVWNTYPYTVFVRVHVRKYRIKPDDPRGILQVSESGGVRDDWTDIAVGIVDMQFAMKVLEPNRAASQGCEDCDQTHTWYSGAEMATVPSADPANQILQLSVTLVGKTNGEIAAVTLTQTPDLFKGSPTFRSYNSVGDRPGTALPVTTKTSWPDDMLYGNHVYRTYTATTDLRNIGVGYW